MGTRSPASLTELQKLFRDEKYVAGLTVAMRFIVDQSKLIVNSNLYFQSATPHMLEAFDRLDEIQINYSMPCGNETCQKYFDGVHTTTQQRGELLEKFAKSFTLLTDKLTR